MATTSQPAVRENGYVVPPSSSMSWWVQEDEREDTPELKWPASVRVYNRMRRQDAKVGSVMRAVKAPLMATTWRLEPGHASDEVTAFVSRQLGLPIKGVADADQPRVNRTRGRFSWSEHLRLALLMLDFGHMAFEQVYAYDEPGNRLHLRKLGPRFPWSIHKFNVARDGGLISIEQTALGTLTGSGPTMPVSRLVVYSHEREGGDWWGQSLLRPAYKHWLLKDRNLRLDTIRNDRNSLGIPVHTAAEGAEQDDIDQGLEIAQDVRSGESAGASLAHGADLKLLGVQGATADPLKSVEYNDDQIGTAVLAHFLNLGRQTGSWALGSTFADFFVASLNGIGTVLQDTANQHIVEDLVDLNFGEDEPAPRIVYDDLAGQDQALAYAIKALVDAGVLQPDTALDTYLRTAYKLPQRSDDATSEGES